MKLSYAIVFAASMSLIACVGGSGGSDSGTGGDTSMGTGGDTGGDTSGEPSPPGSGFDLYGDLYNGLGTVDTVRVTGRLVHEDEAVEITETTPTSQLSQDEARNHGFTIWMQNTKLADASTDDEGYFDVPVDLTPLALSPGVHTAELRVDNVVAGVCELHLLPVDDAGVVVRSDVDLTYLNTDFQSSTAKAKLMIENSHDRETLPGMAAIYQTLDRPTVFLSGSPLFFKRILEGKMQLDGVDNAGLVLKPYKDLIMFEILEFDPAGIVPSLHEQVGYKLTRLLELRQALPATTGEILMGDDSEADHVVYNLYHRFTSKQIDQAELMDELKGVDVVEPWLSSIEAAAPAALAALEGATEDPVRAIYINKTPVPGEHFTVADWAVEGLTIHHDGAGPLATDLAERGFITQTQATEIGSSL